MSFSLFYCEIYNISVLIVISFVITSLLLIIAFFISTKKPNAEKLSAYECGFDPYEDARNMFDVRFYLVSILFLVFDLETIYFFPWCIAINRVPDICGLYCFLDFIVELLIGYIYLWRVGVLNWE